MGRPAFTGMLPHLSVSHNTGLASLASDAASRGKFEALHALVRQLGVVAIEVQVSQVALDLLHNAMNEFEKLQAQCPYSEPPLDIYKDGDVHRHPGPKARFIRSRGQLAAAVSSKIPPRPPFPVESFLLLHGTTDSTRCLHQAVRHSCMVTLHWSWQRTSLPLPCALETSRGCALRTSSEDLRHWRVRVQYCESMGTTPWRVDCKAPSGSDQLARLREVVLMSNALMYFIRTGAPRSNQDKTIKL